jgi:hypothetical protein
LEAVTRSFSAALVAAAILVLAAPAQAASPSAAIKPPMAGDVTLAHLVFTTKGGKGTPKLVVANRAKLSKQLTIAGGVTKLKKNTFLASIALLHRTGGSGGATPSFKLSLPKGMAFSKFTAKQIAKNLLSTSSTPKFCSARPESFAYVSKKLLNGSFPPRFPSAMELVIAGYDLNCPGGYEDRANLAAALRGEPDPGAGPSDGSGPGGGDGDVGGEDGEDGGVPTSTTLTGSGTVTSDGPNAYRYSMTFNEPISGFLFQAGGTSIACPNQYDETGTCTPHNSTTAGGVTLNCKAGYYSFEFECLSPSGGSARDRTGPATVPANTEIVGSFTIDAGSLAPGKAKVTAYSSSGKSQPITLSGP